MPIGRHLVLLLGGSLLAACNTTLAFHDEFTTDTVGGLPNPDPPGEPVGDRLGLFEPEDRLPGLLTIVEDGALESRALRISDVPGQQIFKRLTFFGIRIPGSASLPRRISWRGVADFDSEGANLYYRATNSRLNSIGMVNFSAEGELLLLPTPFSPTTGAINLGGVTEGKPHTFVWSFDPDSLLQSVVLYQLDPETDSMSANLNSGWVPVVVGAEDLMDDSLHLDLLYGGNFGSSASYVIDSVKITVRE